MLLKARLDKIWLHKQLNVLVVLRLVGFGPNFPLVMGWVGLGQSADGLGWIGSHKMDPRTTLVWPSALVADLVAVLQLCVCRAETGCCIGFRYSHKILRNRPS